MKSRRRRLLPRALLGLIALLLAATLLPVLLLRFMPPPTTAYMLQSPVKPVQYQWVAAEKISDSMRRAVVASEDQKFWDHHGFDVEAIEKAYEHNQRSNKKRGASTISQQTAKNLFLWAGGGYFRKGLEAGYTVLIEKLWNKQRILEMYLNIAEFGPGIYGVEAASQAYFHHSAAQLSASEAASLAAVLPSPRHWNVRKPGPFVQSRINWIMGQLGYGHRGGDEPEIPDDLQQQIDAENAGTAAASEYAPAPSLPASEAQSDAHAMEQPAAEPPHAAEAPADELTRSLPATEVPHPEPAPEAPAATP